MRTDAYDKANRLTSATDPSGYSLNYALDLSGDVTTLSDNKGTTVKYEYGSGAQETAIIDPSGMETTFAHDDKGRIAQTAFGDGLTQARKYDEAGRLTEMRTLTAGVGFDATKNAWESYAWDATKTKVVTGDFTGDGKADVLALYNFGVNNTGFELFRAKEDGSGFYPPVFWYSSTSWDWNLSYPVAADFDRDGKDDLMVFYYYPADTKTIAHFFKSTGTSFNAPVIWWDSGVGNWDLTKSTLKTGDFNGDGKADVAALYDYGSQTSTLFVFTSTGTSLNPPARWWDSGAGAWDATLTKIVAGDATGDGKADITAFYRAGPTTTTAHRFVSNGSLFMRNDIWSSTAWDWSRTKFTAGDLNGDKQSDVLAYYGYGGSTTAAWTFISDGYGFSNVTKAWEDSQFSWDNSWNETGDVDADGKADGITFYNYGGTHSAIWLLKHLSAAANTPFAYEYTKDNKIKKLTSPLYTEDYGYDSIGRLTSWIKTGGAGNANEAYTYDAAGNITAKGTRTFTYDAADRITSSSQYSDFSYDENGNLTRFRDSTGRLYELTYNPYDQLTQVKIDGVIKANYEYNYKNLRSVKKDAAGAVVKRYHYDKNDNLVRESDAAGATIAFYTWNDKGQPVTLTRTVNQNGTPVTVTYYYHLNARGDVVELSGYGESYEYDPWGKVLKAPTDQVGAENPIRYAGYYYDTDTGLYYVKARYYSPDLGRWLTKDPDGGDRKDPQSINPYIYVDNDPVNKVDPDGKLPNPAIALWIIGIAVAISLANYGYHPFANLYVGFYPRVKRFVRLRAAPKIRAYTRRMQSTRTTITSCHATNAMQRPMVGRRQLNAWGEYVYKNAMASVTHSAIENRPELPDGVRFSPDISTIVRGK